ncbi:hypothetical protein [Hansschlegelia zhihuaiae]|uniref:Uncharacterized protein n=1 Tax=Hansschlegelia zhihuaiae TaxID=405005 RepID=A0A4Q0M3D5_9HYPH|nr:hypothetical protein [Hansschlegelia zhihuaiae]RXF67417.1 hypothetical protein EK403_21310 [Hansschlegelia zhihuaiae]
MRIALAATAFLAVVSYAGDARAQAKMGVNEPCGKAPKYECLPAIFTTKDPVTLSTLKFKAPSAGKATVTFSGFMACDFSTATRATIQIRTDKEKPELAPAGVEIVSRPQFDGTSTITLVGYFDVVKGTNRFNAQALFDVAIIGSPLTLCKFAGGQMGYTFLPD